MSTKCPNKKSTAWERLLKITKGDEDRAMNTFIQWGYNVPEDVFIAEKVVNGVGFKAKNLSSIGFGRLLNRIKRYNNWNNTSHGIKYTSVKTDNELRYDVQLVIRTGPKRSVPIAKYEPTLTETVKDIEEEVADVQYEVPKYNDKVVIVNGIHIVNGNEYWFNNELYPSMEDALAAKESLEYQLESSGYGKAVEGLDKYLTDFLSKYGITVKQIEDFKDRFGVDGIAVADMLNKMVLVAQGKADALTIPEEAAHFIIEMLGESHPLYKAMEKIIKDTSEYKEVVEKYGELYGNREKKLMKEAMGKILAKKLYDQYQGKNSSLLDRVIQWFKNLFKTAKNRQLEDSINSVFDEIAQGVLEGYIDLNGENIVNDEYYFELGQQDNDGPLRAMISRSIKQIENRAAFIARETQSDEALGFAQDYRMYSEIVKEKLYSNQLQDAVLTLVEVLERSELPEIQEDIRAAGEEGTVIHSRVLRTAYETIGTYEAILNDIVETLEKKDNIRFRPMLSATDASGLMLEERIAELTTAFSTIKRRLKLQREERFKKIFEEIAIEYVGPDGVKVKFNAEEVMNSKVGSINWIEANVLPMHAVSDDVLRAVLKIVKDIHTDSFSRALADGNRLKQLQLEMNKAGFKDMSIFFEKKKVDKDGKQSFDKTGYLLTEYNWGEYNEAYDNTRKAILEYVNKNRKEDNKYTNFYGIQKSDLTKDEVRFYENSFKSFSKKYRVKVGGIWEANPPKNPEFDRVMNLHPTVRNYYDAMKEIHLATRNLLPKGFSKRETRFLVPQIRMDDMQLMAREGDTLSEKLAGIKRKMGEKFKILEDDKEYGDTTGYQLHTPEGKKRKLLPIYFTRRLPDMRELSDDTTSMYAHFSEMANNFYGLTRRLDDLYMIQMTIAERDVYKNQKAFAKGEKLLGTESNEYKALQKFMDMHVFGEYVSDVEIKVGKKILRPSKAAFAIIGYLKKVNLFLNLPVMVSGNIKANIDAFLDSVTGLYITKESQLWANVELGKNMHNLFAEITRRKNMKQTKIGALMQYSGASGNIDAIFNRLDLKNPLQRFTAEDFWYGSYEAFGITLKLTYMLAVYDNYRLVNGEFITKEKFKELNTSKSKEEVNKEWKELRDKSLYNAYEIDNGVIKVKPEFKKHVTPQLENTAKGIIQHRLAHIEGNLSKFDRAGWSTNILGQLLMMHRGWMVAGLTERFKKGGVNYDTGIYEEGFYRSVGKTIVDVFNHEQRKLMISRAYWKQLQPYQKRNLLKSVTDLTATLALFILFKLVNNAIEDSDDDDWGAQMAAYLTTRAFLEQGAFTNPIEFINILNTPSAAFNVFDTLKLIFSMIYDHDPIEYGVYEDWYHWQKGLMKISPLKNVYEAQAPEDKNKFVKHQML